MFLKELLLCLLFAGFMGIHPINGQVNTLPARDSIAFQQEQFLSKDTLLTKFLQDTTPSDIILSSHALEEKVEFGARDSMEFDITKNKMYLYGKAFVQYQGKKLKAGYIEIDLDSNIALAHKVMENDTVAGRPSFSDGSQQFEANKMRYNFKSQKGVVYGVSTTQGNLFLRGAKTKFISRNVINNDATSSENIFYNKNAIFTTCDLDHPHYGIRSKKQKVIPNKMVISGLSNLEVAGIPLPIAFPFAIFPLKQIKSTGLIFPQGYEYSRQWGFGLDGIGWYFPINDYIDLRLTGQIYWHGTWGITADSEYRKRYKYDGNFNLSYSSPKNRDNNFRTESYSIQWTHNQDVKAHPSRQLNANVDIQSNDHLRLNNNDAQSVLQNNLSSNVSFSQRFPGKPFQFTASMSHSQNTSTREMIINFPTLDFQMDRIYPFKNKDKSPSAKDKWYEKISFDYDATAKTKFTATDTTIFSQQTLKDTRAGIKHKMSTDLNFTFLKHFNLQPNAHLLEVWNFDRIKIQDTTQIETPALDTVLKREALPFRTFNAGVSLNTSLYGTMKFRKGWIRGIRHTLKPSISFNYTPVNGDGFFRNNIDTIYFNNQQETIRKTPYNIFQGGAFSQLESSQEKLSLDYSFTNIFEAKYFSKKDTMTKKLSLFDNLIIEGEYNILADSFKFSEVITRGRTKLFQGVTNISFHASWDPYTVDENNKKIDKPYFNWKKNKKFLRFLEAEINVSTEISVASLKKLFNKEPSSFEEHANKNKNDFLHFIKGLNLEHILIISAARDDNQATKWSIDNHSIGLNVEQIQVSKNWSLGIGNIGYNLKDKKLIYPDFRLSRNLHCWEASFSWRPQRGTYFFTLKVKKPPLDAIKIPFGKKNKNEDFKGF